MGGMRVRITLVCLVAMAVVAWVQGTKAGLWEMTATQTWQQVPVPHGNSTKGVTQTINVCVTQQQLDKYGAILPPSTALMLIMGNKQNCRISGIVKKANGSTAVVVCTAGRSGEGTLESTSTDGAHATGKIHFVGSLQLGPNSGPEEWTIESTSVYKGADCGDVKPYPLPEN
jgi:hypothetical protein